MLNKKSASNNASPCQTSFGRPSGMLNVMNKKERKSILQLMEESDKASPRKQFEIFPGCPITIFSILGFVAFFIFLVIYIPKCKEESEEDEKSRQAWRESFYEYDIYNITLIIGNNLIPTNDHGFEFGDIKRAYINDIEIQYQMINKLDYFILNHCGKLYTIDLRISGNDSIVYKFSKENYVKEVYNKQGILQKSGKVVPLNHHFNSNRKHLPICKTSS